MFKGTPSQNFKLSECLSGAPRISQKSSEDSDQKAKSLAVSL